MDWRTLASRGKQVDEPISQIWNRKPNPKTRVPLRRKPRKTLWHPQDDWIILPGSFVTPGIAFSILILHPIWFCLFQNSGFRLEAELVCFLYGPRPTDLNAFCCSHCDYTGLPFVRSEFGKFYRFPPIIGAVGQAPLLFVGINPRVSDSNRSLHEPSSQIMAHSFSCLITGARARWRTALYWASRLGKALRATRNGRRTPWSFRALWISSVCDRTAPLRVGFKQGPSSRFE